jgi:hypothetical protein
LNGNVQTFLGNISLTSHPLQPLTLTAKYRIFDLNDNSDQIVFPGSVLDDRTVAGVRRAPRMSFRRQNADGDARWQFSYPIAVTLGGGWERWDRDDEREVPTSDEPYAKLAVDATPFDWLLARVTYRPSFRRIESYNTRAFAELTVVEDPGGVTQGQSVLLRKFDEADRDRQRVDVLLQLTPLPSLSIAPNGSWMFDNYLSKNLVDPSGAGTHDILGVQEAVAWNAGIDLNWTPFQRLSFSAGYMHEVNYRKMESRSRPVVGVFALDFTDFDWISNTTDTVDTLYGGVKLAVIPGVLDLGFNGSWSYALGRVETRNPTAPVSSTAANNFSATAKPMPAFEDELIRLEIAAAYHFWKHWTATLGYVFESFQKNDWRTDQLDPFVPTAGSSIWLGNDLRNYTAHTIAATLGYRF